MGECDMDHQLKGALYISQLAIKIVYTEMWERAEETCSVAEFVGYLQVSLNAEGNSSAAKGVEDENELGRNPRLPD